MKATKEAPKKSVETPVKAVKETPKILEEITMQTTKEKVSYCIGLETGRNLKNQFGDMDLNCLTQGFTTALNDTVPALSKEEVQSILLALKNQIETQQRQNFFRIAEDN
jgi:hypothetical protein